MEKLLTYGLQNGVLKHISEVQNGLSCDCVCSNCGQFLVAKNNPSNKKSAHFAHHSSLECEGAYESALHLLAKAILLKTKELRLPDFHHDYNRSNESSFFESGRLIAFEEIIPDGSHLSFENNEFIPDSIGVIKGKEVLVEFAKTHFVDNDKLVKIKGYGSACLEIDLRQQTLDEFALISFFKSKSESIYWLYNPKMETRYKEWQARRQWEKEEYERIAKEAQLERQKNFKAKEDIFYKEQSDKLNEFRNDSSVEIFFFGESEIVGSCPKRALALEPLKNSAMYRHRVLKRIIDGEYWNESFYGRRPSGKWIYLNQEKIYVYKPDNERENETSQEQFESGQFFKGLNQIHSTLSSYDYDLGKCNYCEFMEDIIKLRTRSYAVCKHPKFNSSQPSS